MCRKRGGRGAIFARVAWLAVTTDVDPWVRTPARATENSTALLARWVFWACIAGIAVAGSFAVWLHREWLPTSDLAWQQLVLQNLTQDPPLLGAYSRWGWSHPGPFFHYFLWIPWRLLGGAPAGLLLAMLGLHLLAVVLAWLTARTRSVALAVLVACGLLLAWGVASEGEALLPWNPMVGLLLAGTFVVAAGDAATRGRWGVALLLPVGSVLIQSHVGTALLVLGVVGIAVVLAVIPRGQEHPIPWRALAWSVAASALLWLAPLVAALPDGGNLLDILTTDTGPGLGWGVGARTFSGAWSVPAYWWSSSVWLPDSSAIPVLLIVPVAAVVLGFVRRDWVGVRWLIAALAAALILIPSVALADQARSYVVAWAPATVVVCLAISIWVILRAMTSGERWVERLAPILLVPPAVLVIVHLIADKPVEFDGEIVRATAAAAQEQGSGVHIIVNAEDRTFALTPSVVTELRRRGIEVSAQPPVPLPAGLVGLVDSEQDGRRGLLIDFPQSPDAHVPEGWQVLVDEDPFTAQEWRELARYRDQAQDPALSERERALALLGYEQIRNGRTAWRILLQDRG